MRSPRARPEPMLVNGSTGDPALFVDLPGRDDALLFDAGDNAALGLARLGDLDAVFITHHHVDHFIGLDRIVRANLDRDKALHIYGPAGTIRKVYDRITSYEYPFFPFQKIVLRVHEVLVDRLRSAPLECSRRFPEPEVVEADRDGPGVYEAGGLIVEAEHVDHTVPCLAFALVERPGPGPVPAHPAACDPSGTRVAYVTDTAWSEASRPGLLRLAHRARRLYCDAFYSREHAGLAEKYRHMTASQAAEFARLAEVEELVLIHFSARYQGRYEALVEEARAIFPRTSAEIPAPAPKES
jgi:ribonuclease Z